MTALLILCEGGLFRLRSITGRLHLAPRIGDWRLGSDDWTEGSSGTELRGRDPGAQVWKDLLFGGDHYRSPAATE